MNIFIIHRFIYIFSMPTTSKNTKFSRDLFVICIMHSCIISVELNSSIFLHVNFYLKTTFVTRRSLETRVIRVDTALNMQCALGFCFKLLWISRRIIFHFYVFNCFLFVFVCFCFWSKEWKCKTYYPMTRSYNNYDNLFPLTSDEIELCCQGKNKEMWCEMFVHAHPFLVLVSRKYTMNIRKVRTHAV